MANTNEFLLDLMTGHSIGIQRVATSNVEDIQKYFDQINKELITTLGEDQFVVTRRQAIANEIRRLTADIYVEMGKEIIEQAEGMAAHEINYMFDALKKATSVDTPLVDEGVAEMIRRALNTPMNVDQGVTQLTIKRAVDQYAINKSVDFFRLVSDGILEGKSGDMVSGEVSELLNLHKRQAEALVRTSTNAVAAAARSELFEKNKKVLRGYEWVAKLDHRTTIICMSLDNKVFKIGEGPLPPAHWRCRSQTTPVVLKKYSKKVNNEPGGIDESYQQWLKRQPAKIQDGILGKTRGALFRRGDLPLTKFVDKDYQPLTLKELKQRDNDAFEKANLD